MTRRIGWVLVIVMLGALLSGCAMSEEDSEAAMQAVQKVSSAMESQQVAVQGAAEAMDQAAAEALENVPDLAAAAEALGVTEDALVEALGDPSMADWATGEIDYDAAAETLEVTLDALMDALEIDQ